MRIFDTIIAISDFLQGIRDAGKTIGFVPTMGALHDGHLDLMKRARSENDYVAVSIFVNPIQFNNQQDLVHYPKTLKEDIRKLESIPCDLLFHPTVDEMYPGPVREEFHFGNLEHVMEGQYRPGHFNGVAVVVKRLFGILQPHKSYFGEKDYQQLKIVEALVRDYQIPVEIVACPTVREADGLAMSSRNRRLTQEERKLAPLIFQTLQETKAQAFELPVEELKYIAEQKIKACKDFSLEYFEIADGETLLPAGQLHRNKTYVICIAAFLGNIRLIDNVIIR